MADYNSIDEMYRIVGIRNIGIPKVYPKTNVAKKKKKRSDEEESLRKAKEREASESESGNKSTGIDIEV